MCACSEAFHSLRACAVLIVGVAGTMPAHGIGTACFMVKQNGRECIVKIHNCLLCHGEDQFNLISVSQLLRARTNSITFSADDSRLEMDNDNEDGLKTIFKLKEHEGLYELEVSPLSVDDERMRSAFCLDLTLENDPHLWDKDKEKRGLFDMKAPTKLGTWYSRALWVSLKVGMQEISQEYDSHLKEFCDSYFVPPTQPSAKRTYRSGDTGDMAQLSLRFMGIGNDRLIQTLKRSKGLTPPTKKKGETVSKVPPHNFPQGKWKKGKTPRVSKGKVENLHRAAIAEVCFTDTFETADNFYRYGQVVVDYRSRFGDAFPIRSRKKVGWAFGEFCCRHFVPLILIRDNISENAGGDLMEECHRRGVKSAFSCPYTPQQNYSEGYLGRITTMASFAMVLSGAPIFMWRWAIICAVFVNNITATYYRKEGVWATPWELTHGEPFPDSSIVVPFGCAALVMLSEDEREKFKTTCAMLIFIHYALDHPLYTYAFFSPRTKRVIFRQDCIFLPEIFPMREARARVGLLPEGEPLVTYRVQQVEGNDSFGKWKENDPLPPFQDHVTGFTLASPPDETSHQTPEKPKEWPRHRPYHPAFGVPSIVDVPCLLENEEHREIKSQDGIVNGEKDEEMANEDKKRGPSHREIRTRKPWKGADLPSGQQQGRRRPVKERWFYEPIVEPALSVHQQLQDTGENGTRDSGDFEKGDVMVVKERNEKVAFEKQIEKQISCQNRDVTDQSECFSPEKKLLSVSFDDNEENTDVCVRKNFLVNNNKVFFQNSSPVIMPDSLGPVESLPEYLENLEDTEDAAWDLQGIIFPDEDLGWCIITGWGSDHGTNLIFYAPVDSQDPVADEEHASLSEILGLLRQTPLSSRITDYMPSRTIKKPGDIKSLMTRRVPTVLRQRPKYGTMLASRVTGLVANVKILPSRVIIRILKAQDTLFKYGTMIPKNDREAEQSPEAPRWRSGRTLEWLRLRIANTFETDWTWDRVRREHPSYLKSDVGYMFYVYDYKYSGEHRVRLVFDGSRQSKTTYSITYAPTVRAESVRLFHLYAVEYGWSIQQYDVPQAFLRSDADCTIFVYPPKGQSDFPGQLLKLSKMLYGSKQAAALWFNLLNTFLLKLGFRASSMDPCFYRRACDTHNVPNAAKSDAIIILHVDDMRVAAAPEVLKVIHDQLFAEFQITTSDTGRFLGMDIDYDLTKGILKMHMHTYIESTVERFQGFDLSKGLPYRELVGSLLWIVLCVMGPELLRVKDLAKRSNCYTVEDYKDALRVLDRIVVSKHYGIIFRRGGANKEFIPSKTRLGGGLENVDEVYSTGDQSMNELEENNLYKLDSDLDDATLDIEKTLAETNTRFTKVAYSDASFAVGETKQSITGFIILINGTPILWGSLKQTVVVDSTCSAEYVAASVCCKQIMQAENMVQFLDFTCPKPYRMYTDSQACLKIATNGSKLGMVRHLEIRYHLIRCIVLSGDIVLEYCITEDMLADLFTKIVTSAQDRRLAIRFYNDCVSFTDVD
jgi:hypothetical protein